MSKIERNPEGPKISEIKRLFTEVKTVPNGEILLEIFQDHTIAQSWELQHKDMIFGKTQEGEWGPGMRLIDWKPSYAPDDFVLVPILTRGALQVWDVDTLDFYGCVVLQVFKDYHEIIDHPSKYDAVFVASHKKDIIGVFKESWDSASVADSECLRLVQEIGNEIRTKLQEGGVGEKFVLLWPPV